MLLYRCMGTQYIRCRIIGLWNNERCYNWFALISSVILIFRLWNGNRCYIGRWGDIPDEIFRLWNNECCYNQFALISSVILIFRLWNGDRCYISIWGSIPDVFFVCGMTNVVIQMYGDNNTRCRDYWSVE